MDYSGLLPVIVHYRICVRPGISDSLCCDCLLTGRTLSGFNENILKDNVCQIIVFHSLHYQALQLIQHRIRMIHLAVGYHFDLNQNARFTNRINAGTSINGPITPAKACPELIPNTPTATAIANSKLLPVAVNDTDAFSS